MNSNMIKGVSTIGMITLVLCEWVKDGIIIIEMTVRNTMSGITKIVIMDKSTA